MSVRLDQPFAIPTARRYSDPADQGIVLPIVFGDFTSFGRTGPLPTVMINAGARVYAAAAHAVESITEVWVGETLATVTTDYVVNLSNNYEAQGTIATITFTVGYGLPRDVVSWRGKGLPSGGSAITNPVTQIETLLQTFLTGFTSADWDTTTLEVARGICVTKSYAGAWAIADLSEAGAWLTEMLFNILGGWRITSAGTLQLLLDDGATPYDFETSQADLHLVAARDCVDGDLGVTMSFDLAQLVNALDVDYAYHWVGEHYSSQIVSNEDATSKNAYGEFRKRIQLRGVRVQAHVNTVASVILARQSFKTRVEGAQVAFAIDGSRGFHLAPGDLIGFSWSRGPTRERGNDYVNEFLRLLEVEHDAVGSGRTRLIAQDLGAYITTRAKYDKTIKFKATARFGGTGRSLAMLG